MAFSSDMESKIVDVFQNNKVKNILHIGACLGEEKLFYPLNLTLQQSYH